MICVDHIFILSHEKANLIGLIKLHNNKEFRKNYDTIYCLLKIKVLLCLSLFCFCCRERDVSYFRKMSLIYNKVSN